MINLGSRIVNNWLFPIHQGYVLIDTGYEQNYAGFRRKLQKRGIDVHSIRYVFLTHAHDDHAGFLNQLMEAAQEVQVIMSDKSLPTLYRGQNSFDGGCTSAFASASCAVLKLFGKGAHRFPPLKSCFESRCIPVTEENRSELEAILHGTILATPGHTADSISLLLEDGSLFCGDAAMNGVPSVHRITIWVENVEDYCHSWETILASGAKIIYPGHGNPFPPSDLRRNAAHVSAMRLRPLTK